MTISQSSPNNQTFISGALGGLVGAVANRYCLLYRHRPVQHQPPNYATAGNDHFGTIAAAGGDPR